MNVTDFIAKRAKAELKERSAAQEYFIDLCHMVGHKTPVEADPTGAAFCFEREAEKHGGGEFGLESIRHFNGSLFDDNTVLDLTAGEVETIIDAARLDWSAVDPSIFGTLFERVLDPAKRSQLGAYFTGKADIELLVEAVVMTPLRREWDETKAIVENLLTTGKKTGGQSIGFGGQGSGKIDPRIRKAKSEAGSLIHQFLTRLGNVKVLDPACGSGNFLYVTLQKRKDLEKAAIVFSLERELGGFLPMVGPLQLYGIELNPYAHDLAQMTVWIGWLQWIEFNGKDWVLIWTIDFALMSPEEAAQYHAPFEYVKEHVCPTRSKNRRASYAEKWGQYAELRPGMRAALKGQSRFIATPRVSTHRIFVWLSAMVLANDGAIVFAREDGTFSGGCIRRFTKCGRLNKEQRLRTGRATHRPRVSSGWDPGLNDDAILEKLLELNLARAG
ncbi:MAG: type IIL restriction-modification enzyme MmeI [Kiritimatiellia bacterium]